MEKRVGNRYEPNFADPSLDHSTIANFSIKIDQNMGETYKNAKGNKSFPSEQNQWLDYKQAGLVQRSMTRTPRYPLR